MQRIHYIVFTSVILVVSFFTGLFAYLYFSPVVSNPAGYVYYLKPGTSKSQLQLDLAQEGVIKRPRLFSLFVYTHPNDHLKKGEYFFAKGSTLVSIWKQMTTGTGLYYRSFAIIPGWSFKQLRQELARTETLDQFTAKLTDKQIMAFLGKPDLMPEGQFLPESYYYTRGNPDLVVLKRAFDLMQKQLNDLWSHRASGLPYKNMDEALIVASLVEKEAYLATERPLIAGVIINRINKNMLLQIDPTVIYGMGERYAGKIHKEDLHEDTPYNTYVHKGLPPTPIAMPSLDAIKATLHPAVHDFYYFVAKGDGSHQFSKSLPEHNKAVKDAIEKNTPASAPTTTISNTSLLGNASPIVV